MRPPTRAAPAVHLGPDRSRRRRRLGLLGLLAIVGGTVTARAVTAPPPHQALAGPLPSAPPHVTRPPAPSAASPAAARARPVSAARRVVTGRAVDVGYGTVEVRVTLAGRRILDVAAVSLPEGGRSTDISAYAAPVLRREALAAQSAAIDAVSGASYTSQGYAQSLQSALDAAA